jgi:hypothetical protein
MLKRNKYRCRCGERYPFPVYAIAQMAMGHRVTHTCDACGRQNTILSDATVLIGKPPVLTPRQMIHCKLVNAADVLLQQGAPRSSWFVLLEAVEMGALLTSKQWQSESDRKNRITP